MDYSTCKQHVEELIKQYLHTSDYDQRLRSSVEYALAGGKRLRSTLSLALLEKLQPTKWRELSQVILIPELIHSASLVIDDLPAFDNDKTRRGRKCVHLEFGEGVAYLLSFTLVTEAAIMAHNQLDHLKKAYTREDAYQQYEHQMKNVITNISSRKAIGGQLLSTFHTSGNTNLRDMRTERPQKLSHAEILRILEQKTASFFEIGLVAAWINGHGDINKLPEIRKLSSLLGICYQIYDDYMDYHQDVNSDHFSHNYIYHRGTTNALQEFNMYHDSAKQLIIDLDIECPMFEYILEYISSRVHSSHEELKSSASI